MKIIHEADLRAKVSRSEALEAARRAFRALGAGAVSQPSPVAIEFPERDAEAHVKCAYLHGSDIFVVKVASGFYDQEGEPPGSGAILVLSARDGSPLGVLADNGYLTDLRTAAAAALAVDLLTPKELDKVAIIGTGTQARAQLHALAGVRTWNSAAVWGRTPAHAAQYAADHSGLNVVAADTPQDALAGAQLVITTTRSGAPVIQYPWLESSATVIAVGSDAPHKQELDTKILANAKVIADDWSQCLRLGEIHHAVKAGDLDLTRIYAELGKVVSGERAGREGDELIVCDFTGVGALDAAIAETAWEIAG